MYSGSAGLIITGIFVYDSSPGAIQRFKNSFLTFISELTPESTGEYNGNNLTFDPIL